MPTFDDDFSTSDDLNTLNGQEVESGLLKNTNLDEGTILDFNGSSQYVQVADHNDFSFGDGATTDSAFTFAAWVLIRSAPSRIAGKGTTTNDLEWQVAYGSAGNLGLIIYDANGSNYTQRYLSDPSVLINRWFHLVTTYDGSGSSGIKVYVNGVRVDDGITTVGTYSAMHNTTAPLYLGKHVTTASGYLDGQMDDVRIYRRELSATEVFALAQAGVEPSTTNLVGHWKFNDGSGVTATDSSGNSHDGDLTGHSPTWTTSHKKFYTRRSESISTNVIANAVSISTFNYTTSKKSGGSVYRFKFSDDGSTWKTPSGLTVSGYGSYEFDGVNDSINCGSDTSIDNIFAGGGTVMLWMCARSYPAFTRLFNKTDASGNGTNLNFNSGLLQFIRTFSGGNASWTTQSSLKLGRWYHIAVTYNENSASNDPIIYIDGIQQTLTDSNSTGTAVTDAAQDFVIGNRTALDRPFDGFISDIRVYKGDILAASTIYDYYAKGIEPSETLDAHWKFNGNALDETSNNNDGTVSGAVNSTSWYHIPAMGYGQVEDYNVLKWDGTNDYMNTADRNIWSFGNGTTDSPFSLASWVFVDSNTTRFTPFAKYSPGVLEYLVRISTGLSIQWSLYDNSSGGTIGRGTANNIFPVGKWMHLAVTYDGSRSSSGMIIYMNGIRVDTVNINSGSYTAMENLSGSLNIGFNSATPDYGNGKACNASVWSDVRTQAEIIAEVENGYVDLTDANLIASWPVNEGTGNTVANALGNTDYDMTANGPVWIKDISRPVSAEPSEQSIDVSGLSLTDLYYSVDNEASDVHDLFALDDVNVDYIAFINITRSILSEILLTISNTYNVSVEFLANKNITDIINTEILKKLEKSSTLNVEINKAISLLQNTNVEFLLSLQQNKQIPTEILINFVKSNNLNLNIEILQYISNVFSIPVEILLDSDASIAKALAWCILARSTSWTVNERSTAWTIPTRATAWTVPTPKTSCD